MGSKDNTCDFSSDQNTIGRQQTFTKLRSQYLDDLPVQLEKIESQLHLMDYDTIKKDAHRIKGTSGTYHLDSISRCIAQLEQLADSKNKEAIIAMLGKVKKLVQEEIDKHRNLLDDPQNSGESSNG